MSWEPKKAPISPKEIIMDEMRYRKPSIKTILGITTLKKHVKKVLGINKPFTPFRAAGNYQQHPPEFLASFNRLRPYDLKGLNILYPKEERCDLYALSWMDT